jgi:hypothetical protein
MALAVSSKNNMQVVGALVALAEMERSFRDVGSFVERTAGLIGKYWAVVPLLAAAWAFMVSDEERFAVLEGITGSVLDAVPIDDMLQKMLTSGNGRS